MLAGQALYRLPSILLFLFILLFGPASLGFTASQKNEAISSRIQSRITQMEEKFGLAICWRESCLPAETKIQLKAAEENDDPALAKYLGLLEGELDKYPRIFFKKSRIETIILAKAQFYGQKPVEGLYQLNSHLIVIDFKRQADNPMAQQHNIHHELFHVMETQTPYYWGVDRWDSFNPAGFRYEANPLAKPGENALNYYAPSLPGFVTYYAMTSPFEDRSETFACLMVQPESKLIHRWAKKDNVLKQKIQAIKAFTPEFCSQMDKTFWANLEPAGQKP